MTRDCILAGVFLNVFSLYIFRRMMNTSGLHRCRSRSTGKLYGEDLNLLSWLSVGIT